MKEVVKRLICFVLGHDYQWRRHQYEGWEIHICRRCYHSDYSTEVGSYICFDCRLDGYTRCPKRHGENGPCLAPAATPKGGA